MNTARLLRALPAVVFVATAAFASAGGTAPAADAPSGPDTTSQAKTTWSIQPSTASGPTTRTSFDFDVVPGTDLVDYVGVDNYSNRPLTFQVYASDAFNTPSGGTDALAGSQKPVDIGSWVKFPDRRVLVPANSRVDLPFRIDVPTNATPGDHVGAVLASLATVTTDGKGRDVTVDRRVGTRINMRVQGDLKPVLTVRNVRTSYAATANPLGGELTVTYDVVNTGNVQLSAHQEVAVKAFGVVGVKSAGLPDLDRVLPGNTVTRTELVSGVAAAGLLDTAVKIRPFAADGDLEATPAASTASDSTVAIPWIALGVLVLLIVGALTWRRLRKRRKARAAADLAAALETAKADARAEMASGSQDS